MIPTFKRFRLLTYCILAFGLYSCENHDLIAPKKPPLPACGSAVIQGYTDKTSYLPGNVMKVYLHSTSDLQCGLGFYDVRGTFAFSSDVAISTQFVDSNEPWLNGFHYSIYSEIVLPHNLASGIYFIENKIPFVVKSSLPSDITVVYPINTINAYNPNGGKSLYGFNSTNSIAAYEVSYLRPLADEVEADRCIECLRWFPSQTDIKFNYISDLDLDSYSSFSRSKILVITGHSEYWTRKARSNFDQFINSGNHAVLLSGNTMWWQVRYSSDRTRLICYRSQVPDPEPDESMKTVLWTNPTLNFSILKSIGADFDHGGYGLKVDNGWNGYKIVNPDSPLLEGTGLMKGDIISVPSDECDGAPLIGFDSDGFPILENKFNFQKLELIGFDRGARGGAETFPTFIAMKASSTSGIIINMGSIDWCSSTGIAGASGAQLKIITNNAFRKLLSGSPVFSN